MMEEFDKYIDKLLDRITEVGGMDKLDEDEIEYLKTQGKSVLPKRIREEQELRKIENWVKDGHIFHIQPNQFQQIKHLS